MIILKLLIEICFIVESLGNVFNFLFIIPELNHFSRIRNVAQNLKSIINQYQNYDCIVFISVPRTDLSFWTHDPEYLEYISSICDVVDKPLIGLGDTLYMMIPSLIQPTYQYIAFISENVVLSPLNETFPLREIIQTMEYNNLTVISPRLQQQNANSIKSQKFRDIMQTLALEGSNSIGHLTSYLSLHFWIMTGVSYRALWELLYPSVNPSGCGLDLWYNGYASSRVPGHRMGIITTVVIEALQDPLSATLNATTRHKIWRELRDQEQFYDLHFQVPLETYRQSIGNGNDPRLGSLLAVKSNLSRV